MAFCGRKVESTRNSNFGNNPGDIRLQSGDQEVWSKIWSLPDYMRELTALRRGPTKQLFALDFFKKLLYKQLEVIKIKSNYWSLIFLYIQADNNLNKINGKKTENK